MMRTFVAALMLGQLMSAEGPARAGDAGPTIIAMEQRALERWGKGDPGGYFEIMAPAATYFDPTVAKRVDGIDALHALIDPFRGKIHVERAEMIDPKVQQRGDLAVLTFNLISHGARFGDGPKGDVRWNSTEVYQRISGQWKIVHSHWSYTTPALKEKPAEEAPVAPGRSPR